MVVGILEVVVVVSEVVVVDVVDVVVVVEVVVVDVVVVVVVVVVVEVEVVVEVVVVVVEEVVSEKYDEQLGNTIILCKILSSVIGFIQIDTYQILRLRSTSNSYRNLRPFHNILRVAVRLLCKV